jgi:hypothetical protein
MPGKARRYQGDSTIERKSLAWLRGELVPVTDDKDSAPGLKPKQECYERNRDRHRLQMARRHIDDEARELSTRNPIQLVTDRAYMPVRQVPKSWVERYKATPDKGFEVRSQDRVVNCLFVSSCHFFSSLSLFLRNFSRNAVMIS